MFCKIPLVRESSIVIRRVRLDMIEDTEEIMAAVKDSFAEHIQSGGIMNADDGMIMKQLVEQIIVNDDGIEVHFKCGIVASHEYL